MVLKAVLQWKNDDSTRDLNSRFSALFEKGVLEGGLLVPVASQLKIDVQPFSLMSNDGMLVTQDTTERLDLVIDQTNVISLLVQHNIGAAPTLEYHVTEISIFNSLVNKPYHVVFGEVTVIGAAVQAFPADITYNQRNAQDKRGRSTFRGKLATTAYLPSDPNFNLPGDFYMINAGVGDIPELWAWNGLAWINITQTLSIASDLAQHRANLFTNEIHLTDDQANAALGTFGTPGLANRYVTSTDPRIPTQGENDALVGTTGSPSSTNKYVTESYPVTAPVSLSFAFPPGGSVSLPSLNGPFYVGTGAVLSANKYFFLMDYTENQGYTNSLGLVSSIVGVFKDAFLSVPLNPAVDAAANGYFSAPLFIHVDNLVDTPVRVVYGQKQTFQTLVRDFTVVTTPGDATVPASVVEKITNIKGRPYGTLIPTTEQNITLRADLDSLSSYIGSVLETNVVAADEDFLRLALDPVLGSYFVKNIGVDPVYTFHNVSLVTFSYNATLGRVTYGSAVNLSSAAIGNRFIDGNGVEYTVVGVNDGADTVDIVSIETGEIPATIITSVGTSRDGSLKENNNPRDLLLSEVKFNFANELIPVKKLDIKKDEFSKPDGNVAYGLKKQFDNRFEPRVVFFGGFENYVDLSTGEQYVRNASSNGKIVVTGFFTGISLVLRRKSNSPALNVSVNGKASSIVTTSALGTINANIAASAGPKYQRVQMASGLSATAATTISMDIAALTAGSLDIFGIEIYRDSSQSDALLESGRAFQSARIVQRDSISTVTIPQLDIDERGGRLVYDIEDNSYSVAIGTLLDLDRSSQPSGTASGSVITVTAGVGKLVNYRANDILLLTNGLVAEMRRINSISGANINLDAVTSIVGSVLIKHIASTDSTIPNTSEEDELVRYSLTDDFLNSTSTDFKAQDTRNRFVVHTDGHTLVSGTDLTVTTSGIVGAASAVKLEASGTLKIRATCTRLDLIAVNQTTDTVNISIDGSPSYAYTFSGTAAQRRTIFFNSRYQDHEVVISGGSGTLCLSEVILFGPKKPSFGAIAVETADLLLPARYTPAYGVLTTAPYVYPLGAIFYEGHHYISKINGTGINTDWSVSYDFTKSPYGPYVVSENDGCSVEFYFFGDAFELQYIKGPDHGIFTVSVDGVVLESTGGIIVGDYTGNQVDAYSASYGRQNIGAHDLAYGYHKVTAALGDPRTKNVSATNYLLGVVGYFVGNNSGYMSYGLNREGVYTGVVDLRNFTPLKLEPAVVNQATLTTRSAKVALTIAATSAAITFVEPMPDTNYVITATLMNTTDTYPNFQPIMITGQTFTGFDIKWNSPLPTSNYVLNYVVLGL